MNWNLVADIGGTNMRLAAGRDDQIARQLTLPTVGERTVVEAITDFIADLGSPPQRIAIAAAGIVQDGSVTLTNAGTRIAEADIRQASGVEDCRILNDFEAAAWSLADVSADDVLAIQGDGALRGGNRIIVGPGTGLGVGALVLAGDRPHVIKSEGGHVRLSPDTAEELEIFRLMGEAWPQTRMGDGYAVEAEAVLSGTGLPHFHRAVGKCLGMATEFGGEPRMRAGAIFEAARKGDDAAASKTVHLFAKYLGEFAGDMGVTFSALGGVFLAGGVVSANPWIFDDPVFLEAFNSGGRHSGYRKSMPVYVHRNPQFGLLGALGYLRHGIGK